MKIRNAVIGGVMLLPLALMGCSSAGSDSGSTESGSTEPEPPTDNAAGTCDGANVAYITPGLSIPFWRSLAVGVGRATTEVGATVTDYDSDLSASTQLQNAQDAITAGVDAIIISPTDSSSAPAVLELAAAGGVPVVIADIGTDSGEYLSFIKTDNIAGAAAAGNYLVEVLQKDGITEGEIGIVGISQARQNGKDRTQGFTEVVEAAGYTVLPLLESADYTRSEGMTLAQDLLTAHPNMVGLFTEHDEATQGALTAFKAVGASNTVIVGFDGSPDTLAAIEAGTLGGAAMQQPVLMGREAMNAVCANLSGETVEDLVMVDTVMVTGDNVAEVKDSLMDNVFAQE